MPARGAPALAPETAAGGAALLIVDMISCWDFPDAAKLLRGALPVVPHVAALRHRCRRAGVPVIYANDNRGRWRSDFSAQIEMSMVHGGLGARITQALMPDHDDYFVLKPKQSAFVSTPLELLLQHLGVRRLIITGVASDQCVLATASDARLLDLEVVVPRDCVATQSTARHALALQLFEASLDIATTSGPRIRLATSKKGKRREGS
jgi:nicotinamidase-related amidase